MNPRCKNASFVIFARFSSKTTTFACFCQIFFKNNKFGMIFARFSSKTTSKFKLQVLAKPSYFSLQAFSSAGKT